MVLFGDLQVQLRAGQREGGSKTKDAGQIKKIKQAIAGSCTSRMKPVYHAPTSTVLEWHGDDSPEKEIGPVTQISLATSSQGTELLGQVTAHSSGLYGELVPNGEVGSNSSCGKDDQKERAIDGLE